MTALVLGLIIGVFTAIYIAYGILKTNKKAH